MKVTSKYVLITEIIIICIFHTVKIINSDKQSAKAQESKISLLHKNLPFDNFSKIILK
jgi:hypothetical protein